MVKQTAKKHVVNFTIKLVFLYTTGISPKKFGIMSEWLRESINQMASSNPNYFAELMPANYQRRFFPEFRDED